MEQGKSAIGSVGVLASLSVLGISLYDILNQVINSGALPEKLKPYALALGGFLALFGRLRAKKQITSVV